MHITFFKYSLFAITQHAVVVLRILSLAVCFVLSIYRWFYLILTYLFLFVVLVCLSSILHFKLSIFQKSVIYVVVILYWINTETALLLLKTSYLNMACWPKPNLVCSSQNNFKWCSRIKFFNLISVITYRCGHRKWFQDTFLFFFIISIKLWPLQLYNSQISDTMFVPWQKYICIYSLNKRFYFVSLCKFQVLTQITDSLTVCWW